MRLHPASIARSSWRSSRRSSAGCRGRAGRERPIAGRQVGSGDPSRVVPLGTLVSGHGVRGLARVKPFNPESPTLLSAAHVWLSVRGGARRERFRVRDSRRHRRAFLLALEGIDSLDALAPWIGSSVEVEAGELPPVGPSELYHFEALGLEVRTRQGRLIGTVEEVLALPSNDVWVVRPKPCGATDDREHLIPVVGSIVVEIDLAKRLAVIDPLPGLIEE